MKINIRKCAATISLLLSFICISCNMFTYELPCFLRGRWIAYDAASPDSNIVTAVFDFDNKGNYKKTETNQDNTYMIVIEGKYEYSYYSMNYTKCTGTVTLTPDGIGSDESESYLFEVEMNAENGLVGLNLNNTSVRKKYELEYGGPEDIYITEETPEEEGGESEPEAGAEEAAGEGGDA